MDGIAFTEVDGQLMAHCRPAADRPPIDAEALHRLLDQSGYANWSLLPDALDSLAKRLNSESVEFSLALGKREDARVTIELAPDGSCAWANVTAARGGKPARPEEVVQALADAGVVFGIDMAAVQQACESSLDSRVALAAATLPQNGDDTRFELLVADTRDRTPKVDEHGLIDFHELGDIPIAKAGQALMRRHPPTPGVDGHNVRGEILRASPGLDEAFDAPLIGACIADDDPNLLRALYAGQPVRTGNAVTVEKVLYLKDVSLATGNINFDGTVEVEGDVHPGMKLHATGDIVVKGMVEGAQLDAGGSIQVAGGIVAHAVARAGSSVSARFVENASIHAATAIAIESEALHSDLQALNQVLVGTESGQRGRLVGGSTRATMLVRTPLLGAAAGGLTKIRVGVNPQLEARCDELEAVIEKQKVEEDKLHKVVQHLTRHGDPRGMLERVQAAWKQTLDAWGKSLAEKAELDRQLAQTSAARIEVGVGVAGEVDIVFGKTIRHLRRTCDAGAFWVSEEGRVVFTDAAGQATDVA